MSLGVIGMGKIGSAVVAGLVKNGFEGNLVVSNGNRIRTEEKIDTQLFEEVTIAESNEVVVTTCSPIIIALKQKNMYEELTKWREKHLLPQDSLLISFVAGIDISLIKRWVGNERQPVVRVMPNTPIAVCEGALGWTVSNEVDFGQQKRLHEMFSLLGASVFVEDEDLMHEITAVSGSGPAYYLELALAEKRAVAERLTTAQADLLVRQTLIGIGALVKAKPDVSLETLLEDITSFKGTTAEAREFMRTRGFSNIVGGAIGAAKNRSREMSQQYNDYQ
jgi:pyrroline-5-carboxylate reductase